MFDGFEDSLLKSSSFPLYDEPRYDMYDDDISVEVLDIDQPAYDDDEGKMDGQPEPNVQPELFIHNVPNKTSITLAIVDKKIACEDLLNGLDCEALLFSSRWLKETPLVLDAFTITSKLTSGGTILTSLANQIRLLNVDNRASSYEPEVLPTPVVIPLLREVLGVIRRPPLDRRRGFVEPSPVQCQAPQWPELKLSLNVETVGPRIHKDRERFPPNNILLTLAGAGMLWLGWTGFNGGAPYAANIDASVAILNTHICTATSLLIWLCLDISFFGKPSVIGAVQGMITGLVSITPAAGLVQSSSALLIGVFSGSIPWLTMMVLHKRVRFLKKIDDTLAIFHTHGIAGALGGLLTGLLADPKMTRLFFGDDPKFIGLIFGLKDGQVRAGLRQMGMQVVGMLFVGVWNVVVTTAIFVVIRMVVALKIREEELVVGDDAIHGEDAYAVWGDGETYKRYVHGHEGFDGVKDEEMM
ncbi:ammonium transporter 3 member 3-like [Dendrobium catenatum]|uniref:ammonium transporter 3 member 3-like n=1 Tax=Dendrobium catenatum TaxID=906689 RepID=UPI00109F26A5|nr:ammonium transporter 3 member 3-like [Dendrobium catenatum]